MIAIPLELVGVVAASGLVAAVGCAARTPPQVPLQAPAGLALTTRGRGPDVVLIHGALGDYRQWEPFGRAFGRGYRVIAVSRRFHWPNPPPAAGVDYTYEAQSADLDGLLQSLGRPAHLVGHSYGAGVALLTTLRHPELVRSLILIEPPFGSLMPPSAPEFASELASRDSMLAAVRASVQAGATERGAEALIDWVQGATDGFRRLPQEIQEQLRANAATVGPTYSAPAPVVTCEQLRALQLPVLILRGEQTRPFYRLIAEAAADCIPGAESAVIPAARHMTIVENPSGSADLVTRFIARH
jgi:pimeloyl-ACP methyl ester carboxylesterase